MELIPDKRKYFIYVLRMMTFLMLAMILSLTFFVFYLSYEEAVSLLLKSVHQEDKLHQFKLSFLTENKFLFFKLFLPALICLLIYILMRRNTEKIFLFSVNVYKGIQEILVEIKRLINELTLIEKIIFISVFIFIFAFRLFHFYQFPLFTDEVFSYVYFVSRGFLVSASYYPGPNNHVFYSELCTFTDLFFNDPRLIMRLPSFIISMVLSFVLFLSVKKYYGFLTGLFTLVLFSFSDHVNFYSIQGRGYILLTFFTFIAGYSLIKYLYGRKDVYLLFFILSSVLGFYTIPVFLYPFLSFAIFTLFIIVSNKWWNDVFRFFIVFGVIAMLVVLFYLPILLCNDFNIITGNAWVAPSKNFSAELFPYLLRVNHYLWNREYDIIITIVVAAGVLSFLLSDKKKEESVFGLLFLIVPLIAISIQKVIPFERVWLYLFLLLSFGLSFFSVRLISVFIANRQTRNIFIGILIFSMMVFLILSGTKTVLSKSFGYYKEMDALTARIYNAAPSAILAEDFDSNTFIKFKYITEGKAVDVKSVYIPSYRFDMIITSEKLPLQVDSSLYLLDFSNSYVKAYRLKK
jgi:hypothetical protein